MPHPTDFRALILRMADELDHARQLYLDDRTVKCPLATEARAALSAAPQQPSDEELLQTAGSAAHIDDMADAHEEGYPLEATTFDILRICRAVLSRYGDQAAPVPVAIPIEQWHEDNGPCLWWSFPIEEPPYAGTPLDDDWPGYHTHFTPIVCPEKPLPEAQP